MPFQESQPVIEKICVQYKIEPIRAFAALLDMLAEGHRTASMHPHDPKNPQMVFSQIMGWMGGRNDTEGTFPASVMRGLQTNLETHSLMDQHNAEVYREPANARGVHPLTRQPMHQWYDEQANLHKCLAHILKELGNIAEHEGIHVQMRIEKHIRDHGIDGEGDKK